MKKNKILLFVIFTLICFLLSSCSFFIKDDKVDEPLDNVNKEEIEINYDHYLNRVTLNKLEDATKYFIEIDGVEYNVEIGRNQIYANYTLTADEFSIHAIIYKNDEVLFEEEKTYTPLVITNFNFDKDTKIATFDELKNSEGYLIKCDGFADKIVYDETIDLSEYMPSFNQSTVTITPISTKDNPIIEGITKTFYVNIEPSGFYYDDSVGCFYWNNPLEADYIFELVINGNPIIVKNSRYYKYKVNEPTVATLRRIGISDNFIDTDAIQIEVLPDTNCITNLSNNSNTSISWDNLGNLYEYEITINDGNDIYSYTIDSSSFSLGNLNEFNINIKPITTRKNVYTTNYNFDVNVYDDINCDNQFNYENKINTFSVSSTEKNISGYNVNVISDNEVVFNKDYMGSKVLKFDEYQFSKSGDYILNVTPIYIKTNEYIIGEVKTYTYYFKREASISNYSFDNGEIIIPDSERLCYTIEDVLNHVEGSTFTIKNDNNTYNDVIVDLSVYKDYYFDYFYRKIYLPSITPLQFEITKLGKVSNLRCNDNKIVWDYSGEGSQFNIQYNGENYYMEEMIYNTAFLPGRNSVSVYTNNDNSKFQIKSIYSIVFFDKLYAPTIEDISIDTQTATVHLEGQDNVSNYEYTLSGVTTTSTNPFFSFDYAEGQTLVIKAYGSDYYFDSDDSVEFSVNIILPTGTINNSSEDQMISFDSMDDVLAQFNLRRIIYFENDVIYIDDDNIDSIDVSNYECGNYRITIDAFSKVINDIIYIENLILEYEFIIFDYEIKENLFDFEAVCYPSNIVEKDFYDLMQFKLFICEYSSSDVYYEGYFNDTISPDITGLFNKDDYLMFRIIENMDFSFYDEYNIFTKQSIYCKYFYYRTPSKVTVKYDWDNTNQTFKLNFYGADYSGIYYTIYKDGEFFMNTKDTSITLENPFIETKYEVFLYSQIISNEFYNSATVTGITNYKIMDSFNIDYIYLGFEYTNPGSYTISISEIVLDLPDYFETGKFIIDLYQSSYDEESESYLERELLSSYQHDNLATGVIYKNINLCYNVELDYKDIVTFVIYISSDSYLDSLPEEYIYVCE